MGCPDDVAMTPHSRSDETPASGTAAYWFVVLWGARRTGERSAVGATKCRRRCEDLHDRGAELELERRARRRLLNEAQDDCCRGHESRVTIHQRGHSPMRMDAVTDVHCVSGHRSRPVRVRRRRAALAHADRRQTRVTVAHVGDQGFGGEHAEPQNNDEADESSAKADAAMIHGAGT